MKKTITILSLFLICLQLQAQTDTTQTLGLLDELIATDTVQQQLLPDKIMLTQRMLWGKKGLMRNFDYFRLTPELRQNELKIRRKMLVAHQILGFATLGGMVAQGIVGSKLYNGNNSLRETHEAIAVGVNIGYFTTASLSIFAPPKMLDERKGYSSIKLHKILAIVHFSGMIATNILAGQVEDNPDLRAVHRAVAFTTFGAFAASMIVIKF